MSNDKLVAANSAQFNNIAAEIFLSVAKKNDQIQELLILGLGEAKKLDKNDQITNNLDWLSKCAELANATKGINSKRLVSYIIDYLCVGTIRYIEETKSFKKAKKDQPIEYIADVKSLDWYEFKKPKANRQVFTSEAARKAILASIEKQLKAGYTLEQLDNLVKSLIADKQVERQANLARLAANELAAEPSTGTDG